ncbi:MAG: LysR family transcriptional regulator [Lachnospiraceae bacterium]
MDVKYLNYILTIAEKKSLTGAAKELYVSQSSLSQYLAKLEQEIGTPLFFRTKGQLLPTPAGELYLQAASHVTQVQKKLYREIGQLENRGHLMVGVTSQFGLLLLSEAIPRLKEQYPHMELEITEANLPTLTRLLKEESLDLAILAANEPDSWLDQGELLGTEEILFALHDSHPFCADHPDGSSISMEEFMANFKEEPFVLSKKGSSLRYVTDRLFEKLALDPSLMCETNSIVAVCGMIAQGAGVGFVAQSWIPVQNQIVSYSLTPRQYRTHVLVHRKNWNPGRAEALFYQYLKEAYENQCTRWEAR